MVDLASMYGGALGGAALTGAFAGLLALGIVVAVLIILALYIYTSLALMTIGKKIKYRNAWLAWIPVANIAMILQMGGFSWLWIFLIVVPILGWIALGVLGIIAFWRIFEKRKYPGWLALVPLIGFVPMIGGLASIAFLVVLGLVAWKDM